MEPAQDTTYKRRVRRERVKRRFSKRLTLTVNRRSRSWWVDEPSGTSGVSTKFSRFFLAEQDGSEVSIEVCVRNTELQGKGLPRLLPGGRQVGVGLGDGGRGLGRVALLTDFNQRLAPVKTPEYPVPLS